MKSYGTPKEVFSLCLRGEISYCSAARLQPAALPGSTPGFLQRPSSSKQPPVSEPGRETGVTNVPVWLAEPLSGLLRAWFAVIWGTLFLPILSFMDNPACFLTLQGMLSGGHNSHPCVQMWEHQPQYSHPLHCPDICALTLLKMDHDSAKAKLTISSGIHTHIHTHTLSVGQNTNLDML